LRWRTYIPRGATLSLYYRRIDAILFRKAAMSERPPSPAGTLDRFDLAILAILQKDNTTP
jgi:hypothetical protein